MAGRTETAEAAGDNAAVRMICERHGHAPAALLEILHDVQEELGAVPAEVVPVIGDCLNLSRAEVHGVVTFYHDFRRQPPGRHVVKLCLAEACQSMGSAKLEAAVTQAIGTQVGGTSADGGVTVEACYCLGNCALAPAAMVDGQLIGRATLARIDSAAEGALTKAGRALRGVPKIAGGAR
jgi:formate dehydrogenase subunit gamma